MNRICFGLIIVILAATAAPRAQDLRFTIGGGEEVAAEHGTVTVPAVRSRPESGTLTLRYVRFRNTASPSGPSGPPIVFLAGGPGDAATRAFHGMPRAVLNSLTDVADVIAFDQRGTGTSEPTGVTCAPAGGVPLDAPLDPVQLGAVMRAQLTTCLTGIDASPFTTDENADDVKALADAMGVKQLRLLAGSYGTHLAVAVARRHPDLVASMALLGVEGPDDTMKLPSRVDAVLAEIDRAHPGMLVKVGTLLDRLSKEPWTKVLPNGQRVTVGKWDLQRWIADALDTVPEINALSPALDAMIAGDYSVLVRWTIPFRNARPLNLMHLAMDCASFASETRLSQIRREAPAAILGDAINFPMPDVCSVPGLPRLPELFRAPLTSTVHALLVAGTFDGRTPPANVMDLAKRMSNAETLVLPGASHSLFGESKAMAAVVDFFRRY